MCIFIFVNWDTLVPWAYQLCCLPSINNTIQYKAFQYKTKVFTRAFTLKHGLNRGIHLSPSEMNMRNSVI